IDPNGAIENTKVREVASNIHGTQIPQSKITSNILKPLAEAGYIEITTRRGAPNLVEPTPEFNADVFEPLLEQYAERIGVPREALQLRFSELDSVLETGSSSEKRTALTALGVRLGRHLGLEYVGHRTADRGGQETSNDVIMDDAEITLTRWLIHCSADRSNITPTQIASVTTTARLTNANTILYVARSSFREDAKRMATRIMQNEPYTILMLGEQPDVVYDEEPSVLIEDVSGQLTSIRRTKAIPEDGPYRGRSFGDLDDNRETQRTVSEFENRFEEYMEEGSDTKDLSDFTD
ncbi:MAG: restriction endonuclease, partial [Halobacteriaceae archaeon]